MPFEGENCMVTVTKHRFSKTTKHTTKETIMHAVGETEHTSNEAILSTSESESENGW